MMSFIVTLGVSAITTGQVSTLESDFVHKLGKLELATSSELPLSAHAQFLELRAEQFDAAPKGLAEANPQQKRIAIEPQESLELADQELPSKGSLYLKMYGYSFLTEVAATAVNIGTMMGTVEFAGSSIQFPRLGGGMSSGSGGTSLPFAFFGLASSLEQFYLVTPFLSTGASYVTAQRKGYETSFIFPFLITTASNAGLSWVLSTIFDAVDPQNPAVLVAALLVKVVVSPAISSAAVLAFSEPRQPENYRSLPELALNRRAVSRSRGLGPQLSFSF